MYFGCAQGMQKLPGQGSNPHQSSNWNCSQWQCWIPDPLCHTLSMNILNDVVHPGEDTEYKTQNSCPNR